jgi:CheY-like chemotaxis protein
MGFTHRRAGFSPRSPVDRSGIFFEFGAGELANVARRCAVRAAGVHFLKHMTEDSAILLVEDNEDDVFLMRHALASAGVMNPVFVVETGAEAVDYLSGVGAYQDRRRYPVPTVVFLDLKLPLMSGHEVLAWIRAQSSLEGLLVVVLTSSNEPSDVRRSYSLGANSYLVKPLTPRQLLDLAKALNWTWLRRAEPTSPPAS